MNVMNQPNTETETASTTLLQRLRLPLLVLGPVIVVVAIVYFFITSGRYESTDDAYVKEAQVPISANVAGRVVELDVRDNQYVHRGDVLYKLDDRTFRIAVDEAQAHLAEATLRIKSLKANYLQKQSQLSSALETQAFEKSELDRQKRLFASGISSQSMVDRATHALEEANAQVNGAQHEVAAIAAQLGGDANIDPARHPDVQQAQAALERARLNLSYTEVHAPADGVVTQVEQLQIGSYVAASAPVFALVLTNDVWLEANFKEDQLTHMRAGQEAEVKIDSYPGVVFHGTVASISPGTGSQFSVLPPENATGNWVKVVQRLPVRIELEHPDSKYPLHAGLSARVNVDTRYQRRLFASQEQQADETVAVVQ